VMTKWWACIIRNIVLIDARIDVVSLIDLSAVDQIGGLHYRLICLS